MKYIFILSIISLFVSCYQVKQNCNYFKTGTYKSEFIINEVLYTSYFARSSNIQISEFNGIIDTVSVHWVNDCEAIFKTFNPKKRAEEKDLRLKILTTTNNGYNYEISTAGDTIKYLGQVTRVSRRSMRRSSLLPILKKLQKLHSSLTNDSILGISN